MAGDWVKMRVGLSTHPRVMRIAECLVERGDFLAWAGLSYGLAGYPPPSESDSRAERHAALRVTRYVTVTALLRWWGYANEHAKGEKIAGIFPEDVDEITGVPGFASALDAAGWVEFDESGGATLPNFEEHNTSADARSNGAERQKRYRERLKNHPPAASQVTETSDVTRDVTVTDREEKRREEKKNKTASPSGEHVVAELPDWMPSTVWHEFVRYRKQIRKPMTLHAQKLNLGKLESMRAQGHDPVKVVNGAIANGWQGLYPERPDGQQRGSSPQQGGSRAAGRPL